MAAAGLGSGAQPVTARSIVSIIQKKKRKKKTKKKEKKRLGSELKTTDWVKVKPSAVSVRRGAAQVWRAEARRRRGGGRRRRAALRTLA